MWIKLADASQVPIHFDLGQNASDYHSLVDLSTESKIRV